MGQQPRQFTPNQQMSMADRHNFIMEALDKRSDELAAILPPDISFTAFHATINQAIRANPSLLEATSASLINACVKAAYDGLRVDGREAAITVDNVKVSKRGQPDRYEKQARYMPMYQGLCQQLYRGGLVLSCEAHVIYENDAYDVETTRDPPIMHRPLIVGARGAPIMVFNIARLKSGARSFAWMSADEVRQVQMESRSGWDSEKRQSKGVWAKWEAEQWKKTIVRRHRKTLPVGMIRDMEAADEFPQFDRSAPDPMLAPPRPMRGALPHQPDNSPQVNFGGEFGADDRGEIIDAGREEQGDRAEQQQRAATTEKAHAPEETAMPVGEIEWGVWATETEAAIAKAVDMAALTAVSTDTAFLLKEAPRDLRDRVTGEFTDRAADIAAGSDDGAAAGGGHDSTAAGDL